MDRKAFIQTLYQPNKVKDTSTQDKLKAYTSTPANITAGLGTYNGPWTTVQAAHLLKRTMFGAKFSDISALVNLGTSEAAVDAILNIASLPLPSPPIKEYVAADNYIALGNTWVNDNTEVSSNINNYRRLSFQKWWIGAIINQDTNIREKMTMFWHNHFGTEVDNLSGYSVYVHNTYLRQNCLGNFKDMVKAITKDPAMLDYLNGRLNTKTAPDENYGRELMELFTLGKGPGSQYTQSDVHEAARALTGWDVNNTTTTTNFKPSKHDNNAKVFSSFFGSTQIPANVPNTSGPDGGDAELDLLLNMIFAKDEVAKFICRKIYRFFVYYKIDATIETNIIEPLALLFINSNFDILPVMDKLLKSEHFYEANIIGSIIKSPLDYVIGLLREFQVEFPVNTDYDTNYKHFKYYMDQAGILNQDIADPPNVSGWAAYYQTPSFHEIWINASTYATRTIFVEDMLGNGFTANTFKTNVNIVDFVDSLSNPSDPNQLIADLLTILYSIDLLTTDIPTFITDLKENILCAGPGNPDSYWTTAWNAYKAQGSGQAEKLVVKNRLTDLVLTFIKREEYHLS